MLQGYIVQHGEYSYYFVITVNGVNLSKFYFKKQHSWDEKLYGHLVNQVFLPHNLPLSFKLQTPSAHTKKKKETNKKHLSCSPEKGIQILKTKDKEAGKEVSGTATLAHLWKKNYPFFLGFSYIISFRFIPSKMVLQSHMERDFWKVQVLSNSLGVGKLYLS